MTKADKVAAFIRECFDSLGINFKEYFYFDFEEGVYEEISWCNKDGSVNTKAVEYAAELLGTTPDDILSLNGEVYGKKDLSPNAGIAASAAQPQQGGHNGRGGDRNGRRGGRGRRNAGEKAE